MDKLGFVQTQAILCNCDTEISWFFFKCFFSHCDFFSCSNLLLKSSNHHKVLSHIHLAIYYAKYAGYIWKTQPCAAAFGSFPAHPQMQPKFTLSSSHFIAGISILAST